MATPDVKMDIVLLVDQSGVSSANFDVVSYSLLKSITSQIVKYLKALVQKFRLGRMSTQFSLLTFANDLGEAVLFKDYSTMEDLLKRIASLKWNKYSGASPLINILSYVLGTVLTSANGWRQGGTLLIVCASAPQ